MPVNVFSKEEQKIVLSKYNDQKKAREIIPEVDRNFVTGWPLLNVTLFSPTKDSTEISPVFENAIGGGKCGFFYVGGFCFASLLKNVPGVWILSVPGAGKLIGTSEKDFGQQNIDTLARGYKFEHKLTGIVITEEANNFGKSFSITVPDYKETKSSLKNSLTRSFKFALKPNSKLTEEENEYTLMQIMENINENATFFNGQIAVDLGALLDSLNDKDLKDYFNRVFKVDEFLELKKSNPEFMPKRELVKKNHPEIKKLYSKIQAMKEYGASLNKEDAKKSKEAVQLACLLKEKLNGFLDKASQKQPSTEEVNQFTKEFVTLVHSKDEVMKKHRKIWKPIVTNILIAMTLIGLFAIAIKACSNAIKKGFSFNESLFFANTSSELKNKDIEKEVPVLNSIGKKGN